jgi:hypothetical protein
MIRKQQDPGNTEPPDFQTPIPKRQYPNTNIQTPDAPSPNTTATTQQAKEHRFTATPQYQPITTYTYVCLTPTGGNLAIPSLSTRTGRCPIARSGGLFEVF